MTPVSLNPPPARGPSLQGQNNQLFNVSPNNQDYRTTLLNFLDPRQTLQIVGDHQLRESDHHQGDNKVVLQDGSSSNSNHHLSFNSSSPDQPAVLMDHDQSSAYDTNLSFSKMEEVEEADSSKMGHGSAKWMSSKMRLMKRMMRPSSSGIADKAINSSTTTPRSTPRFQNQQGHENIRYSQRSPRNNSGSSNTTRVCSDCNTSSTPLWRSGPMGPKSLCNACGIRQRKARKAMQEAENGEATNGASTKSRVHNKEKKPRTNKSTTTSTSTTSTGGSSQLAQGEVKKLECFAIGLRNDSGFPMDEASEAALLLMDLSYGFFHS